MESFSFDVSNCESLIGHFNVGPLCPNADKVWRHLLCNDPILIIAPSPEIASSSAIAALSLIIPIKYTDPVLFYTSGSDLRSSEIASGGYKLVATCDQNFDTTPYSLVITITGSRFEQQSGLQRQCQRRTERYFMILLALMNYELLKNPYFDILGCPIDVDRVELAKDADRQLLKEMQKSDTFRNWRAGQNKRDQVRTAFVSNLPEQAIEYVAKEQCGVALQALREIEDAFPGDLHLTTVLKKHKAMLKKKMKS
jgi:hypothetical protein